MTHTQATAPRRAQVVEEIGLQRHYIDGEFRESVAGGHVQDAQPDDQRGPSPTPTGGPPTSTPPSPLRAARSTRVRGRR